MLEINVKTIDGQNRSYSVPEDYSVRQFKEKITSSLNIPVDRQRLIFQGRELKDNNALNEFDVNGKTLHLVQRAPPAAPSANPSQGGNTSQPSTTMTGAAGLEGFLRNNLGGILGGGATGAGAGGQLPQGLQQLIQNAIGGLGGGANVIGATTTPDGNGMEVQIDINNISQQVNENEIRSRIRNIRRFLSLAQARLDRLAEINSGVPLEDTSGSIVIGSIYGTAQLSDANGTLGTIGFDIPNLNYSGMDIQSLINAATGAAAQTPASTTTSTTTTSSSTTTTSPADTQTNPTPPTPTAPSTTPAETATEEQGTGSPASQTTLPAPEEPSSINIEVLAETVQSVMTSYATFLPYLQQYHEMLTNDDNEPPESPTNSTTTGEASTTTPTSTTTAGSQPNLNVINSNSSNIIVLGGGDNNRRQRFCNNINDMMHLLGHLFHNLSDLHINIRDRPPRQIHTMSSMQQSASAIISARPVETNITIPMAAQARNPTTPAAERQGNQPSTAAESPTPTETTPNPIETTPNPTGTMPTPSGIIPNPTGTTPTQTGSTPTIDTSGRATFFRGPVHHHHPSPQPHQHHHHHPPQPSVHYHMSPNHQQQPQQQPQHPLAFPRVRNSHSFSHAPRMTASQPRPGHHHPPGAMHAHRMAHEAALAAARARAEASLTGGGRAVGSPYFVPPRFGAIPRVSGMPPAMGNNGPVSSYDPYLPCNSIHFYNSFNAASSSAATGSTTGSTERQQGQRRRHPAGDQQTASGTTTTTTTPTANSQGQATSIPLQNGSDIGRIIGDVISQISVGGNPEQIQVNIGGSPGQISIGTLSTIGNMFNVDQLLGGLGQASRPQPAAAGSNAPAGSAMNVNSLIREALNLMDNANADDQRLNQPLTSLLGDSMFGEDDEEEGSWRADSSTPPTSTMSIFNVLFSSMTLGGMINLARGSDRELVFERSREPLREHIKKYFLTPASTNDQVLTEENTTNLVNRMYSEVFIDENGLGIDFSTFELTNERINFAESFRKLLMHYLRVMLEHVFDTSYDNVDTTSQPQQAGETHVAPTTWSSVLFKKFYELIEKMVLLSRACVRNADVKFTQVVTQKLRQAVVSQNMASNPMFFGIFENFIQTQVQQTLTGITSSTDSVSEFIIYKESATVDTPQSSASTSNNPLHQSKLVDEAEDEEVYDDASSNMSDMDIDSSFNEYKKNHPEVVQHQQQLPTKKPETQSVASTSNARSSWRSVVPSAWLADIDRDLLAQSSATERVIRGPFSDAYCSAMPAKRRKVFLTRNDLEDKNIFKEVLGRTLNKIQLKQGANVDEMVEASVGNSQLIDSFSSELDANITERLRSDADFNGILKRQEDSEDMTVTNKERYQNAKKRFN